MYLLNEQNGCLNLICCMERKERKRNRSMYASSRQIHRYIYMYYMKIKERKKNYMNVSIEQRKALTNFGFYTKQTRSMRLRSHNFCTDSAHSTMV